MANEIVCFRRQVEELKAEIVRLQQKQVNLKSGHCSTPGSVELLNATQRLSKVGGWEWNVVKRTMFWTEETYRIHDFVQDELVPGSPEHIEKSLACYEPADRPLIKNAFLRCAEQGEPYDFELLFTTATGRKLWVRTTAKPVRVNDRIVSVVGNIMDITDRKSAQEQLTESERKLSTLMANLPGMAYRCLNDEFWTMKFVSDGCGELTGLQADHLIDNQRTSYANLIHPDDRVMVYDTIQNSLAKREQFNLTYRIFAASGLEKWVLEKGQGVFSDTGELSAIEGFITDITDRRRAEEALRLSEEKFRLAFKTSPDSINLNRLSDGKHIDINEGFTKLTGFTWADVNGKTSVELCIWDDAGDRDRLVQSLQKDGYVENFEARFRRKDGQVGTGLMSARVLRLHQEDLILSITRDITERKQVEDTLRESEDKYSQLVESLTDAILVWSNEEIKYANPSAFKLFKAKNIEDLIGKRYLDFVHPDDRLESIERIKKSRNEKWIAPRREHRMITSDGQMINVASTGVPILSRGKIQHFGIFTDITERVKTDQKLRDTESKYRELAESLPQVIFEVDSKGNLIYLNQTGYPLFGYKPEDITKGFNVLEVFIPEDRERVANDIILNLQGQKLGRQEYTAVKKDGTNFPVGVHASRVMRANKATSVRGILIDFTPTKQAEEERKKTEIQLQKAQKLEAIGALAGGIAHDFNNILSAIIGYTELAMLNEGAEHCTAELKEALTAANRAKDLVKQILAFSRQTDEDRMPVRVGLVAKEAVKFLRATIPATIEIKTRIDDKSGAVFANSVELHQIIMNLCTNAHHAIGNQPGCLEVVVEDTDIELSQQYDLIDLETGSYVQISIKDTGDGIAPDVIEKIFDPYFTTKEKGVGTGLGLAVVHGIVKKYGGAIRVESQLEKGTTFHIYFPKANIAAPINIEQPQSIIGGCERILFVDDERMLVAIGQQTLERLGYNVVSRTSPIEALELFKAKPDHFDLVITDQTMPGMTGDALARALKEINPKLPVIICTGYSQTIDQERAKQIGIKAFIMKPILIHEIASAVRKVLDKG